jgi:hypothetical protein
VFFFVQCCNCLCEVVIALHVIALHVIALHVIALHVIALPTIIKIMFTCRTPRATVIACRRLFSSPSVPAILSASGQRLWQSHSFINGEFVSQNNGKTFDVINPSNGELIACVPAMTAEVILNIVLSVCVVMLLFIFIDVVCVIIQETAVCESVVTTAYNSWSKTQHWSALRS